MLLIRSKAPIMFTVTLGADVLYPVRFPGIPWHKCAIVLAESSSTQIIDISMPGWCIKAWEWCRRVQDFIARNEVTLSGISFRKAEKRESWTEVYMQHWNMATWYTQIARFMRPTWGPSAADRTQVGPVLAPWTCYLGSYQQRYRSSMYVYEYTGVYWNYCYPIPCIWNIHMYKVKQNNTKHMHKCNSA